MNEVRRRCYIHVGLPKTGTSFLQTILFGSQQALAQQDLSMLPAESGGAFSLHLDMRGQLRRGIDPRAPSPPWTACHVRRRGSPRRGR